ncbi:MAG: tRNA (adenosine(37)-N6)-threonylcarbamoyltransferase complex transferase subunit TsaD [Alphaproteobacteria bacterium]
MLKVLSIESTCDETAVAIINENKQILSHIVLSQLDEHRPYGGVVPEIAARSHMKYLSKLVEEALAKSELNFNDIDAIAVTGGPGLIGGVIVGVMFAKSMAFALNKPFIAINHLEGHALTARLTSDVEYPFLLLLISGGHCQFIIVESLSKYHLLGSTIDDAVGEAFDKVAKMLGLDYPGGPIIEKTAQYGNKLRFKFPKSIIGKDGCNMSFSGLKSAVRREIEKSAGTDQDKADIAASFQYIVGEILKNRLKNAIEIYNKSYFNKALVIAGGVAANQYLRTELSILAKEHGFTLITPPVNLCTDNAAMIGWAAIERLKAGYKTDFNFAPKDRWPLTEI